MSCSTVCTAWHTQRSRPERRSSSVHIGGKALGRVSPYGQNHVKHVKKRRSSCITNAAGKSTSTDQAVQSYPRRSRLSIQRSVGSKQHFVRRDRHVDWLSRSILIDNARGGDTRKIMWTSAGASVNRQVWRTRHHCTRPWITVRLRLVAGGLPFYGNRAQPNHQLSPATQR